MTLVVQATCPGCKNILRIPAQWISQPMRCKHCGLIIQAKAGPAAPPTPGPNTSVAARTPPPPALPPGLAAAEARLRTLAANATPAPASSPPNNPSPTAAPPRRPGNWRKGLFLALCILVIAGIASAVYWPQLSRLVAKPEPNTQAKVDKTEPVQVVQAPAKQPKQPDTPKQPTPPVKPPADPVKPSPDPVKPPPDPVKPPPDPVKPPPDPVKPPVKPPDPVKPPPDPVKPPPDPVKPPPQAMTFPRRALAVSVNNYLYANPINYGPSARGARNVHTLLERLNTGLRIPTDQMAVLSDAAPGTMARPPLKLVIEKAISDFLASSRDQDRVLVFFMGHAVEIEDEPYLVPIEGDLEKKETLIPLKWLFERLAGCKARQKVLVLDVCRTNSSRGMERPGGGPMGAKLDAALKMPPAGVQVWSACVAGQSSFEFDASINNGVFQETLHDALMQAVQGGTQKPDDPLPIAPLVEFVNQRMKEVLDRDQKVQVSRLSGQEPPAGAPYDASQPRPPTVAIEVPLPEGGPASIDVVRGILKDIEVPPIKPTRDDLSLRAEAMPTFSAKLLDAYKDDGEKTPFRGTIIRVRDILNRQIRGKKLREDFRAPANENRFKDELKDYQTREIAALTSDLEEALKDLKEAGKERDKETSKRWQANYDYLLARLEMQVAYLYEYATMLGSMRKDLPPRDPKIHGGWRLAAQPILQGDPTGKKLANDAKKILEKLATEHPDTPWAVLAKRERFTALGLDWQPVK